MKKNKALVAPFVLWAVLFIVVPLVMVVWYGVTVEQTPVYTEIAGDNGQIVFQLEDGTVTPERPQKTTVISLENFKRMLEPTYLKLLLRSLKIALITTVICLLLGYPVALILSGRGFQAPRALADAHHPADVDELPAQNVFLDVHSGKHGHPQQLDCLPARSDSRV
ncbi:MAG: hypothetical protein V8Q79_04330 [Christensenellales bacterium]